MRHRGDKVPRSGVTHGQRPGHPALVALGIQRGEAGHDQIGSLRRVSQRTVLAGMLLPVAVVRALALPARR
ncbi:hypothetical protein J2Z21_009626 [Streptomyces griseochromogenes]|uniref:Uncharacterized protein n=1 Tax=Streptomyces griseochromogenes TaxID=68214 RepID=A0ABS4MAA3_9ACTN|nr:hypothetical protein [Streptomyces griseochromogenes]